MYVSIPFLVAEFNFIHYIFSVFSITANFYKISFEFI